MNQFGSYPRDEIGIVHIGGDISRDFILQQMKMPGDKRNPRHNYILDTGESDVPFVSVHKINGKHKLAGVYVPESMRGKGLGRTLLGVAFELAERTRGIIDSTSIMRKPTVAALLGRYGFSPEGPGVQVKIVGEERHKNDLIPVVFPLSKGKLEVECDGRKFLIVSRDVRDKKRAGEIVTLSVPYSLLDDVENQQKFVDSRLEDRGKFFFRDLNSDFKL